MYHWGHNKIKVHLAENSAAALTPRPYGENGADFFWLPLIQCMPQCGLLVSISSHGV